jgi:transposase
VEYIAIDLGGRESQICRRAANGEIVDERRVATKALGKYLKKLERSMVIVETSAGAFAVADEAKASGHEVTVVPATLVKTLGVGARGIKTDKRDARVLSEVSCRIELPSVHIPCEASRRRKTMCGMRDCLVTTRTQTLNCVRGWLSTQNRRIRTGAVDSFPSRVRAAFEELPAHVARLLEVIDELNKQIKAADKELEHLVRDDELLRRFTTVPGIGPVTAIRYAAAIDDVSRFRDAHQVESYVGLVPGERQSSDRRHRTGITKAGSAELRRCLVQCAWAARRARGHHPMVRWMLEVERRRGKQVASVALARKLVGILYAMWRDGTSYQAHRGAQAQEAI